MKNDFEQRKQNRQDYYEAQAAKNKELSDLYYKKAKDMASAIPMGQPIMVGHHSEKADRRYRDKIHNTYGKAYTAKEKAAHYHSKAQTVADNDAISSDDPQALDKLREKLASLRSNQEFMKAANGCVRKKDKAAFLLIPLATEQLWELITTPDVMGCTGFAGYSLQNNNAEIKRVEKRIAQLEVYAGKTNSEIMIGDVRLVENVEANRVQMIFPAKPAEDIRQRMRKLAFVFHRGEGAWQRKLTPEALRVARSFLESLLP